MNHNIESIGTTIDTIDVKISYRIIELFSGNLYSSPNKAFEELVCNSYDAFADKVAVYVPSDLTVDGACIWVCDNGEGMDQNGFKDLWKIGESSKRDNPERDRKRLQIGRFGIGKLATYILTNRLTYICKKNGHYLAATMNYVDIESNENLKLDEREISEYDAQAVLSTYLTNNGQSLVPFDLFGDDAPESWTFSILTGLKTKASEIKEGRLNWVLRTALPLNPGFELYYNGKEIESSKISKPLKRKWVLGKDDPTLDKLKNASSRENNGTVFIDFENLKGVHGEIELYEDSLVDGSKATVLGRSHGIFLMVRGRLVNLDDPLLGMEAFSHGAFNRSRIIIHADELDDNLASTRESIKESHPLHQLKDYLKKKFNNEVRDFHFQEENRKDREQSISYRMSQTALTLSKRPLYVFAVKFFNNEISNPLLIEKPQEDMKETLLAELKNDLTGEETIIKDVEWIILQSSDPIARLNLSTGKIKINLLHPYIANYMDSYKNTLPLQFIAITEVLTEAHLYEIGIDESQVNNIMRRRDNTLRELSMSDREGAPAVAQMLKDALADPTGLEDAVHKAFLALGFESTIIGGKGKPDGKAEAILGYSSSEQNENYSLTFDAKSTMKDKIQAKTTHLATINKHKDDYIADFAVVVAIDFEGANDLQSTISVTANQQKITVMRATDLMRLLLLSAPKQIGLQKIKKLLESCYAPSDVSKWIDDIQNESIEIGPIKELLDTIYELQSKDTEPPELAGIRQQLNLKLSGGNISKVKIKSIMESLKTLAPGFISVEEERIGIQGTPDKVMTVISGVTNDVPNELQKLYLDAFSLKKNT